MSQTKHRWAGSPAAPLAEVARRMGVELDARSQLAARRLPLRFPRQYADLVRPGDANDPILRIGWPDPEELEPDGEAIDDPVGERGLKSHPLVVRKYPERALVLVTRRCHFYCRFCFRAGEEHDPSLGEVLDAVRSLGRGPEVHEIILSGGDPLVLPDDELVQILRSTLALPSLRRVRIHTRAPVHDPARVTADLARALVDASPVPLAIVIHTTHPRELTAGLDGAIALLRAAGVPLLNQSVLLRGVNDDPALLAGLFEGLHARGVKPYYLHHPDRVAGTARFRLTIDEGLRLYRELRARLPEDRCPAYVIDLPDGSGKVEVETLERVGDGLWTARRAEGHESFYFDIKGRVAEGGGRG